MCPRPIRIQKEGGGEAGHAIDSSNENVMPLSPLLLLPTNGGFGAAGVNPKDHQPNRPGKNRTERKNNNQKKQRKRKNEHTFSILVQHRSYRWLDLSSYVLKRLLNSNLTVDRRKGEENEAKLQVYLELHTFLTNNRKKKGDFFFFLCASTSQTIS